MERHYSKVKIITKLTNLESIAFNKSIGRN
jgi:hypothetical protein